MRACPCRKQLFRFLASILLLLFVGFNLVVLETRKSKLRVQNPICYALFNGGFKAILIYLACKESINLVSVTLPVMNFQ
jgi:hypothetical protein